MKRLKFLPFYKRLIQNRDKTTTFRLNQPKELQEGDEVVLTIGWEEENSEDICQAKIEKIYSKKIKELSEFDFKGESPDCKSREATRLVLSNIYKSVLSEEDKIWIIKFDYND